MVCSVLFVCFYSQRSGGDAATERGLDQHRRQQGLLPAAPGCLEGRRAHRQTAHPPGPFAPQTQRAGLLCNHFIVIFFGLGEVSVCPSQEHPRVKSDILHLTKRNRVWLYFQFEWNESAAYRPSLTPSYWAAAAGCQSRPTVPLLHAGWLLTS